MSEDIISQDEGKPFIVIYFLRKKCPSIQFTNPHALTNDGYVQMTYDESIEFLKESLKRIEEFKKKKKTEFDYKFFILR